MHRELRDPNQARTFVTQGLCLQCYLPSAPGNVRSAMEWALEIASEGQALPPPGFVADLGHAALGREVAPRALGDAPAFPGVPPGLLRAYEDHVLGRLVVDAAFERAGDALRRYEGRDQARGLAYLCRQMGERCGWPGVHLSPGVLKNLLRESPEQLLAAGADSLAAGGLQPLLAELLDGLVAALRRAAELLGPEDVFELEHGTALQELGQRVALRQVLRGAALLEAQLPQHRPRPRPGRQEVPTRVLDEDTYPVGGFSSLSTRGTIESLLHSQLAFMEKEERPDLFDLKYLRDELLYYARDENQFLRRRRTFVFALWPDLVDARVKDPDLPFQRGILLLAWLLVAVRRLVDWLSGDALHIVVAVVDDREPPALADEKDLLELVLRELIAGGTAVVQRVPNAAFLRQRCAEWARRSLGHCLTLSAEERTLDVKHVMVYRLKLAGPVPVLTAPDGSRIEAASGLEEWAAALQELLEAWV
jgi:hypothetical protein